MEPSQNLTRPEPADTMIELPQVARREDRAGGYWEEVRFLDSDGAPVFAVTYSPVREAVWGVIICSSILVEHMTNYRREVLLARALATQGIAVQRFHYRGTGHSEGDEAHVTLDSMVEDTLVATRRLETRTGAIRLAFMGTRWGGLVAAMAARGYPDSPLVLWEPVVDADRYFREMTRARRVLELAESRPARPDEKPKTTGELPRSGADFLTRELEQKGWADMLGFPLHRALYTSGRGKRLDPLIADRHGPVLVIQFDRRQELNPEYARLQEALAPRLKTFDVRLVRDEPGWFFAGGEPHSGETLAAMTTQWLSEHLNGPEGK